MSTPLNVGFVAYGNSTKKFHLPFVLPNKDLNVYAFLQRAEAPSSSSTVEAGRHCTVDFPKAKHYRTADDFFADSNINLVIVCTQHDTHAEFAEKALLAGKHVVVEKPFTVNVADAERLIKLAQKANKILTCYQNRRYDSDFRTLEELCSKSAFGEVTECEIRYDIDFPPWTRRTSAKAYSPGDGLMFGLGTHSIDQALLLFGVPASVTGFYRSRQVPDSKIDDAFIIVLQYSGNGKDNLLVTVRTTIVSSSKHALKYMIRGYNGSFTKFGEDVQESQVGRGMKSTDDGFGVEDRAIFGTLESKKQFAENQEFDQGTGRYIGRYQSRPGSYRDYYSDLVAAIRGNAELKVKAEESMNGIRVIELARESAGKGVTMKW